jgi:hypothetical protein
VWRGLDIEPELGSVGALILDQAPQRAPQTLLGLDKVRLNT